MPFKTCPLNYFKTRLKGNRLVRFFIAKYHRLNVNAKTIKNIKIKYSPLLTMIMNLTEQRTKRN